MIYTSGTTGRAKGATRDFRRMGLEPVLDFISQLPAAPRRAPPGGLPALPLGGAGVRDA